MSATNSHLIAANLLAAINIPKTIELRYQRPEPFITCVMLINVCSPAQIFAWTVWWRNVYVFSTVEIEKNKVTDPQFLPGTAGRFLDSKETFVASTSRTTTWDLFAVDIERTEMKSFLHFILLLLSQIKSVYKLRSCFIICSSH